MAALSPYETFPNSGVPELFNDTPLCPNIALLNDMPFIPSSYAHTHTWNQWDCSQHVYVDEFDNSICHHMSNRNTTECARGRTGFSEGVHCWEIHWPAKIRNNHCVIGVATKEAPLSCNGKTNLVGRDEHSWGWDICRLEALHNYDTVYSERYPDFFDLNLEYTVPDFFSVILDMNEGTLSFAVNGKSLGVAFRGLQGRTLYPIVNLTTKRADVSIRYLGTLKGRGPPSLLDICRLKLRKQHGKMFVKELLKDERMPKDLKEYVINPPQFIYPSS